jgi:hypothetical protein
MSIALSDALVDGTALCECPQTAVGALDEGDAERVDVAVEGIGNAAHPHPKYSAPIRDDEPQESDEDRVRYGDLVYLEERIAAVLQPPRAGLGRDTAGFSDE